MDATYSDSGMPFLLQNIGILLCVIQDSFKFSVNSRKKVSKYIRSIVPLLVNDVNPIFYAYHEKLNS